MKNFFKKNWFGIISTIASFTIILYFILTKQGISSIVTIIHELKRNYVLLAFGFIFMYWFLDGLILYRLTKLQYKNQPLTESLKTAIIGLLYSALTPFAIGGQPMQIIEMAKKNIKTGDAGSIITIKSILYQAGLTFFSIVALFLVGDIFNNRVKFFIPIVILGLVLNLLFIGMVVFIAINSKLTKKIAFYIISFFNKIKIIKNPEKTINSANSQIELFHGSIKFVSNNYTEQIICSLLTLVELIFYYSVTFFVYKSFGLSGAGFIKIIAAQSIITMVTAFVPLPGASGAAEGSFYIFFSMFFSENIILSAVFLWRFITYYLCIIVGGLISFADVIKNRKFETVQ